MNIEKLSTNLSPLLLHMETEGYSARKRHFVKKMSEEIVRLSSPPKILSYEDYFNRFVKPKYPTRSEKNKLMQRALVQIIEDYAEYGILPGEQIRYAVFPAYASEIPSDSEFSDVINCAKIKFASRNLNEHTISTYITGVSSFFYYQHERGARILKEITEESSLAYFNDASVHRGYSQMTHVRSCLLEVVDSFPCCQQILYYLPKLNPRKKVYPYLRKEEFQKILDYILDKDSLMSYRDRAIILLAMFTGLRGCDIIGLKFSDIDWNKAIIRICQKKTGKEVCLPLRPITGNAIWDYVEYERQEFSSGFVFLSNFGKVKPITHSALDHLIHDLFRRIGIRQDGSHIGMHLFRHYIATYMLGNGVSVPVISDVLGHESPDSLDPYVSAEHKHLKECALSIEEFPVRREVFDI